MKQKMRISRLHVTMLYGFLLVSLLATSNSARGQHVVGVEARDDEHIKRDDSVLVTTVALDEVDDVASPPSLQSSYAKTASFAQMDVEARSDVNNVASTSCTDTDSCEVCNSYHTCHWCEHDNACHAIGSYYGCAFGASCKKKEANNETDSHGCLAHKSCIECATASHFCHWCGHDNACHAVGSVYGCVTGVDCYDNMRCKRQKPEPLPPDVVVPKIGALPLIAIGVLSSFILCCATCCCCIMGGIKSAYDDLLDYTGPPPPPSQSEHSQYHLLSREDDVQPDIPVETAQRRPREKRTRTRVSSLSADADQAETADDPAKAELETPSALEEAESAPDATADAVQEDNVAETFEDAIDPLAMANEEGPSSNATSPLLPPTAASTYARVRSRPRPRRAMNGLYNACYCCYGMTVVCIGIFAFSAIYFYPKKPIYNICNDAVAWKSLMDSMTSLKATAEFEILASVYNPNRVDVALDMGKGSFSHGTDNVGTYEIPPVVVQAQSVTDVLIVASFTPEKWSALSIAAEYYRGTLVLSVDVQASIRIPALADYTFPFSMTDLIVHVNDLSDRHLCACPTWADTKNKTKPVLSLLPEHSFETN